MVSVDEYTNMLPPNDNNVHMSAADDLLPSLFLFRERYTRTVKTKNKN